LVSNLNNLGDVVCSTAALALIKANFPGVRLSLIVRPEAEVAVRNHPLVDRLSVFRRGSAMPREAFRIAREVAPERAEAFLSLDRKPGPALAARFLGIRRRIVPDRLHLGDKRPWWLPFLFNEVMRYPPDMFHNLVEMFEDPVRRAFGIGGRGTVSLPPVPSASRVRAGQWLAVAGNRPAVGFSVRANHSLKNWLPERWAEVMDRLEEELGVFIYVTGAASDREYAEAVLRLRRKEGAVNLAGEMAVPDLAALAGRSALFLTLDTGTAHVVGNSGNCGLVVVFTCTEPEGIRDSAVRAKAVWSGERCSPCRKRPGECPEPACQRNVTAEMVMSAAREALADGRMAV
jgi:ADP-heptose:LPS heptosyltransferase